jgi:DNA polymerase-3 subunit delta
MAMDYRTAAREIGKGSIRPVYVCCGEETHLIQEFVRYLADKWLSPEDRDFALSKYDLAETPLEAVLEDAQTVPFFGSRKLVVADNAAFFTASRDGAAGEHAVDGLLAYLSAPADFSVTVFIVPSDRLDERRKITKAAHQAGAVVKFPSMNAGDLANWLRKQAERRRFRFTDAAADKLLLLCGGNLQIIAAEIDKLALHAGEGGTVDEGAVERLVSRNTEQNVFLLVDELARLHLDRALDIYRDLLIHKEEPIKILALIAGEVRLMLLAKSLAAQGFGPDAIAGRLNVKPFRARKALEHARHFTVDRLRWALSRLADLDFQMKTGLADKTLSLELFMMELAS